MREISSVNRNKKQARDNYDCLSSICDWLAGPSEKNLKTWV